MKILVSLLIIAVIAINESHQCLGPRNLCGGKHHHILPMEDQPQHQIDNQFQRRSEGPVNGGPRSMPPPTFRPF